MSLNVFETINSKENRRTYTNKPVHCDLEENKLHGYQQQVEKQEDQHKHAKVQNSKLSSPLQNSIQQYEYP